ncbi:uncharacterized protein [Blastocystis hominis]|uniref:FPL domain-containing protein n=1 Tax=Blastocystis hominis TaxID=12968 RepID=D8M1D4_BLAHO|nr:uncharacterized protein [Blastocystis hominis]CBK21873.2 unnamed protein product [Blastocystis hominis]|eukprot:XP_012895921.1 uncharacterized protein [Blastocystis hominis]
MLHDIISIIKQNRSNKIKIQIIQTISILIQNIKNRTSLFFILSNNHINDLITTPLDFMDEDVVSQYISFLKLLSMNLTPDTVQFFYNYTQSADPFPLFSICSKFYDNPEPMVRIAIRTITLNCLKGTPFKMFPAHPPSERQEHREVHGPAEHTEVLQEAGLLRDFVSCNHEQHGGIEQLCSCWRDDQQHHRPAFIPAGRAQYSGALRERVFEGRAGEGVLYSLLLRSDSARNEHGGKRGRGMRRSR